MTMTDTELRTVEIVMTDGVDRISIPATWRITYGPVIGAAGKASYGTTGNVLRVWEGKDHQRGLWGNVVSFRDLSIIRLVAAVRAYGTAEWFRDDNTWIGGKADLVEKAWMAEDEVHDPPATDEATAPRDPRSVRKW